MSELETVFMNALREIAERGVVVAAPQVRQFKCPTCGHLQSSQGACLSRDCIAGIARVALEARRSP